jgi:hypothetical protein
MRDLTLESLPEDERAITEVYAGRFADSFTHCSPDTDREVALEDARDFISQVWIKMGPQQGPRR